MRAALFLTAAAALQAQPSGRPVPWPSITNPAYSAEARTARLEGVAQAWVEIGPDRKVIDAGLLQGLGMGLDKAAVDAVRKLRIDPAWQADVPPKNLIASINVVFALPNGPHWRIAHLVHRFSVADRQADPSTRKWPVLSSPVLRQYTRPDDAACPSGMAVSLQFPVAADGAPGEIQVISGAGAAAEAAIRAARQWRFDPARHNGDPISTTADVLLECGVPPDYERELHRVGGAVTAPKLLSKIEPSYTEPARTAKFQGSVMLQIEVGPYGYADRMRVTRPVGMGLDVQALDAVRQWKFAPAMRGVSPVSFAATIEVNFRLL
jgi:TonB family protein